MRTTFFAFLGLCIINIFTMCEKSRLHDDKEKIFITLPSNITSKESDIAISIWYVNQFAAIDLLSAELGTQIEYGSKITDSPISLINKQKNLIQSFKTDQIDLKLESWTKLQQSTLKELADYLKCKIDISQIKFKSASQRGLIYLEYQEKIISGINSPTTRITPFHN